MSRRNIRKFSPAFAIVLFLGEVYHRFYYRKFKVLNREKVPDKSPVIFIINHQNALMDALALIFAARRQIVFMARADIFRKKFIASLLYFIKILPVYRIRDGFRSVDQNREVFEEVVAVLDYKNPVAILPEGNHLGEKRLRLPLRKGAARIALQAEAANQFRLGLQVVPVGLDYTNYYNAGSDLLVVFGDPVMAKAYSDLYQTNPALAINQFTDDMADALRKVMIDIQPAGHYNTIHEAIKMYSAAILKEKGLKPSLKNSFITQKELAEKFAHRAGSSEPEMLALESKLASYKDLLDKNRIRDRQVAAKNIGLPGFVLKALLLLILFPVHIVGMALNYIPYYLPVYLSRNIKDLHFLSSVRFGAGFFTFGIWYLIMLIISFFIFENKILIPAFMVSLPFAGIFSFYYYRQMKKFQAEMRWLKIRFRRPMEYKGLLKIRGEIIEMIRNLVNV